MIVVFHNDTFMITQDDNIDFVVAIENDHDQADSSLPIKLVIRNQRKDGTRYFIQLFFVCYSAIAFYCALK